MPRKSVFVAESGYHKYYYQCEWPITCTRAAIAMVRRGMHGELIFVCARHRDLFHDLSDRDAFAVMLNAAPRQKVGT